MAWSSSSVAHVEAWFESLPGELQERAQRIRYLLITSVPGIHEEWRYKSAPFYRHRSWMCYLSLQKGRLVLGFIQGHHLVDPEALLERTDHKQIRHFLPPPANERMDEEALERLILEASLVNEKLTARR